MTPDGSSVIVRSRRNRVLGGVCAGLADRVGVDPLLVRLLVVVLGVFSGGAVALAYVLLWVLLPQAAPESVTAPPGPAPQEAVTGAAAASAPSTVEAADPRPAPLRAVDRAMSTLGDRVRTPEVQTSAREAADRLSAAVRGGAEGVRRRVGRS